MKYLIVTIFVGLVVIGCNFSDYAQTERIAENIDDYRTGCEIDTEELMTGYKQYEANKFYYIGESVSDAVARAVGDVVPNRTPAPTATPSPITYHDIATSTLLEKVWENGCMTGRRDVIGESQATLSSLKDQLELLSDRILDLEFVDNE